MPLRRTLRLLGYALVASVLVGAVLSPPDPFTQLFYAAGFMLLAAPAVVLYVRRTDG